MEGDGNGLNYQEFIAATMDKKLFLTKEKLTAAFKFFDVDGTGVINMQSLREALTRSGRKFDDSELEEMIREVDVGNEGVITFEHFCEVLKSEDVAVFQRTKTGGLDDFFRQKTERLEQRFYFPESVKAGSPVNGPTEVTRVGESELKQEEH
eukprot:TRINITY_DN122_c0_g3_i2.p2 TRINITY_DN122_c0_g3~~TRINITY_DN122_c0_g3_i2.p2  ORF type:complete len:152 (-),score=33.56 TRINITY_DN122_c0_g3_i2:91-546(-)